MRTHFNALGAIRERVHLDSLAALVERRERPSRTMSYHKYRTMLIP
jgi:hypothetical protein